MREAAAVIRSDAGIRNARAGLMRELLNEGAVDHEVFIDLIDAALGV
jgi:prophage DNA circulation protein